MVVKIKLWSLLDPYYNTPPNKFRVLKKGHNLDNHPCGVWGYVGLYRVIGLQRGIWGLGYLYLEPTC